MWSFRRRRARVRNREVARKDGSSLGNLLLRAGMITAEQLRDALEFQDANPERMLGESLVQLGIVEKEVVEALLAMQKIEDGKGKQEHLNVVVELAKNRKRPLHKAHDKVVAASLCLQEKCS